MENKKLVETQINKVKEEELGFGPDEEQEACCI